MNLPKPTLVKPTKLSAGTKGEPPAAVSTPNLQKPPSGQNTTLQVQLSPELRREVKLYATARDMSLSELFALMFEQFKTNNP